MEPPVTLSGSFARRNATTSLMVFENLVPMLRRAATFSHRTERALKDINGRVGPVNKSQEHPSIAKTTVDGEKVTRSGKQYSAVASRYAAPLASKKQLGTFANGPNAGNSNVNKLPFITGRSAPQHQRRPSADSLSSLQPPMVFTASARDLKPDTLAKKADVAKKAADANRPRVVKRASMIEKKSQVQTRAPRFLSLDKGRTTSSTNGTVKGSADTIEVASASSLHSAAYWVSLIKLAEGEKLHEVVIDLFRLAIKLEAKPIEDVVGQLKRYQESYPGDEVVIQLVQQCEGTLQEVCLSHGEIIDKSVCEPEESKISEPEACSDVLDVAPVSESVIVPAIVLGNQCAVKEVAKKPPHIMGRMLSRSTTFSVVDQESKSQHAKAEYGKKLAKTVEFLAMQAAALAPRNTEVDDDRCPSEDSETPGFVVGSKILELATKIGSKLAAKPATDNICSPIPESVSAINNGSSDKGLESPSGELDGDSSETCTLELISAPTELVVDLCPKGITEMSTEPSEVPVPELESTPAVEPASDVVCSPPNSALRSALGNGSSEKPVDSLSEWLDGGSAETATPDIESAPTEVTVDLCPKGFGSVTLMGMDVDSLENEIAPHMVSLADSPADPLAGDQNGESVTPNLHVRRKSWQDAGGQSMTEIVENISRSHRHSLSSEAVQMSVPGSVESKVKLFTELAEVKCSSPESASKGSQEVEDDDSLAKIESVVDSPEEKECVVESPAELAVADEFVPAIPVSTYSKSFQNETAKALPATPLRMLTRQRSMKGDSATPSILATPSAPTPSEPASAGIVRARHRRASSVGNMTPRGPFDMTSEWSPTGDGSSSPSWQSSSTKSKRVSRGSRDVTPRMDLPRPSWKAIIEREMKGSKLKDLLATKLPEETSPLAEYVQSQMENVSAGAMEKDGVSMSSPAKSVTKTAKPSAKKADPVTAQMHRTLTEDEQEMEASTIESTTPGSAIRRSARIQSKVQSRRNMHF